MSGISGQAFIVGAYEHPERKLPDKSVPQIHAAFMKSPPPRANILNSGYSQIGVGVVVVGHEVYVVEDFRRPA